METGAAFECIYEKVESSKDQENTDQDLTAQFRAADSALFSAVFSLLALGVTGVGVWFVKRTLDATLEAVEDTGKATKAMFDANEIARDAQRAWLQIDKVEVKIHALESADMLTVLVYAWITIRNTGRRPAIGIDRREIVRPMGKREISRQFYAESLKRGWFQVPNIPPDGSTTIDVLHMYDIEKSAFDTLSIFSLHISFAYNDGIIETRRQTAQSYGLCKKVAPNGTMKPFTRNELLNPPPTEPGAWSSGWDCDLWPEPDGIMN
jgi:hypothetical protein